MAFHHADRRALEFAKLPYHSHMAKCPKISHTNPQLPRGVLSMTHASDGFRKWDLAAREAFD
jgi:hypothetical protein